MAEWVRCQRVKWPAGLFMQDSKAGGSRSNSPSSRLQRKSNTDIFHFFVKVTNRPMPKLTKRSTLFVVGGVGLIIWKDVCGVQNVCGGKQKECCWNKDKPLLESEAKRKLAYDQCKTGTFLPTEMYRSYTSIRFSWWLNFINTRRLICQPIMKIYCGDKVLNLLSFVIINVLCTIA